MAYTILPTCTACGLCLPACPIDAVISGDPIYLIDQELCCDFEDCLVVCPVDAIIPSESAAFERAKPASPPGGAFLGNA